MLIRYRSQRKMEIPLELLRGKLDEFIHLLLCLSMLL